MEPWNDLQLQVSLPDNNNGSRVLITSRLPLFSGDESWELLQKKLFQSQELCFLYVGAFFADQEIPVWKLRCLWVAEGFIQKRDAKSLEDVAEECLNDLIGGSLIISARRSSNGGVKACRVHDMLRGMCFVRCKEQNFITELESLKVYYSGRIAHPSNFQLPLNLKNLTLSKFRLPWDRISEIGKLPNLEILKLLSRSFEGKRWDMREGEFLKLKFLKLNTVNVTQWNASSDHLPKLERLVVQNCRQLEKIPSGFGEIGTLEIIEIQFCRPSVEESVQKLQEEKIALGNEEFKVFINGSNWNFNSSS